ncbi:ribosome recycling factor [Thermomicrobium sp. 4228-Ro]|uniref:ribosome recycling factor n=1 Tax=Thermomicrobium sp. 4228-Ro TaxID=2993937 RepID=UPI00224984AA|nr:ribosome recycling factor [Thermomicrobium sp. 4228-Ro]MCX2727716.1 ribosome recycling factor [Thermomicrobium sp. 4228-Ro]
MIDDILRDAEHRMKKSLELLRNELSGIRAGRASPSLIEHLAVNYYGTPMPLNQLASITAPESRLLVIQVWDSSAVSAVEKALRQSELGLNPSVDGQTLRVLLPPLTEERRKQLVKMVHQHVEEAKVAIRNIRRDALADIKKLLKEKQISEDDERRAEQRLQDLTNRYIAEADKLGKQKEHDILEV